MSPSTAAANTPTTQLNSKNSDRAHIERNLEDAMNNDWRLFRAQLVAQEQEEKELNENRKKNKKASKKTSSEKIEFTDDEKLMKQGQLGDMFAGAIASIFKNGGSNSSGEEKETKGKVTSGANKKKNDIFNEE